MNLLKVVLIFVVLVLGCQTPRQWGATAHSDMMMTCTRSCEGGMKSYDPWTGICKCWSKRNRK